MHPQILLLLMVAPSLAAAPLVNHGDAWRYRKGLSAPAGGWASVPDASLDATWLSGPGGIGYGDGDDATVLSDMREPPSANGYSTVYLRRVFTVTPGSLNPTDQVILQIDYDDAYVAYLDGVEVARSGNAPGTAGVEPAFDDTASTTREASAGSGGQPPEVVALGDVSDLLTTGEHVLAILGLNESLDSSDLSLIVDLFTQTPPPPLHWTLADSPVTLATTLSIAVGQSLTIDPGVEIRCPTGIPAIDCNGVIHAEGTEAARILFVPTTPGGTWGRISCRGSLESSFGWCDFQRAASSGIIQGRNSDVRLEHCRFIDVNVQMVDFINTSCVIQHCEFDSIQNNELLHFTTMPASGHALIAFNRFGLPGVPATSGYNDIVDFTGGNRPGPIPRFIGNIFLNSGEDCFDMDSTDAHIEGNIFLNVRKDAARDSSSNPITTGAENSNRAELVVCRNVFYNCEHLVMIKDNGTVLLQNNSALGISGNPLSTNTDAGGNEAPGIVLFGEPWRDFPYGNGVYYEGNIVDNITVADPWPILSFAQAATGCFLVRRQNCIEGHVQPGPGNLAVDPLFVDTAGINENTIMAKLALQPGSPCRGTGPNGLDMGALVPAGASISGEPPAITTSRSASLAVAGPGIWAFRWRLDDEPWSDEVSLVPQSIWNGAPLTADMFDAAPPIVLTNLPDGVHHVEVLGKTSGGDWQESPTLSRAWTVTSGDPDTDLDGMPDGWETAHGFAPDDPNDAMSDADADGARNRDEFIAGTDPRDHASVLLLIASAGPGDSISLRFPAVAGKSYVIQFSESLAEDTWQTLETFPVQIESHEVTAADDNVTSAEGRFYRLVTPAP